MNIESNRITWNKDTDPTPEDIAEIVKAYLSSEAYLYLENIGKYYNTENVKLFNDWRKKAERNRTPNWCIPTAYYSTLVDSTGGYLFGNIVYTDDTIHDELKEGQDPEESGFSKKLNETFKKLNIDTIDMETSLRALAHNKGCEIVYTEGDKINKPEIHVVSVDPRQMIFLYDNSIEPKVKYGIRVIKINEKDGDTKYTLAVDFISSKEWTAYRIDDQDKITLSPTFEARQLFWTECPCIEYKTETLNDNTAFSQVIPLIDALDAVITGNSNELDKLADAILLISKQLDKETLVKLGDLKLIEGVTKDDVNQFIQRQTDPEFRRFIIDVLTREIHKQAHVIDFYSPDNMGQGDASGKALRTRMVDMNMFCDRIEKSIKAGFQKRIRLFKEFFMITDKAVKEEQYVNPVFNRTKIVGIEDVAPLLNGVTFLSDETKQEASGLNPKKEKERLEKEKLNRGEDVTDLLGNSPDNKTKNMSGSAAVSEPKEAQIEQVGR